ncbi:hypothetical protein LOK49_LG02G01085 [Camellia lanceoleosa]|uniref:Uncharacterized protein n=1 Tax=Camellia lanceoleosa TaxID=1840588 RepID=A0ACC0IWR5_9ERIC|nr:hypothetical protein LOK49_LG02G01085 [Camellia lanceoleosa]
MEDLTYHQNPPLEEPAGATVAAAVEVELQQQIGSNMEHCYNNNNNFIDTHLMQEVVHHSNQVLQYDQSNWDNNFKHEIQEMSFHNHTHHHQKSVNFQASLGFLGDLPSATDIASVASSVIYDPHFHLNLPAQPLLFGELF